MSNPQPLGAKSSTSIVTDGLAPFGIEPVKPQISGAPASETQPSKAQGSDSQASESKLQAQANEISRLTAQNQSLKDQLTCQQTLVEQLHQAEAAMLQAEKMATLGMLMAGVAHELNTPLGAIKASAENLDVSVIQILRSLPQLCKHLDDEKRAAIALLLSWAEADPGNRSSREERQLRRAIKAKLQALDIDDALSLAATLSAMGVVQALEPILPILRSPHVELFLDAAHNLSMIQQNGKNITTAVSRADSTVSSLRNYIRKGSHDQPALTDLRSGIETVLTLYQSKLKHGIEVRARYDDVPLLLCYPEELEQAWANLIGNAIQAMDGKGTLDIALIQAGQDIQISITDSGPGIPVTHQSQIFAPYYTTKPRGEGSGLGLAITQKIIGRHRGLIEVDSSPGKTRFCVSLPLSGLTSTSGEEPALQDSPFHFSLYHSPSIPHPATSESEAKLSDDPAVSPIIPPLTTL